MFSFNKGNQIGMFGIFLISEFMAFIMLWPEFVNIVIPSGYEILIGCYIFIGMIFGVLLVLNNDKEG